MFLSAPTSRLVRQIATGLFFFVLGFAATANAHGEVTPLWAMTPVELARLEASIERHRVDLVTALEEAARLGVSADDLSRPYLHGSKENAVDIPRGVLNRVILSSLALETESMKMYLFCEGACQRSLFTDLASHPQRREATGLVRKIWPKIRDSFALLWRDIPIGAWKRMIHGSGYLRSLAANARYQAKAYGTGSMLAGAAAFGTAFGVTEIAETMFMGPFHFVCQANYFWSVAIGAAVASLSRDAKTLLLFDRDGKSVFSRLRNTVTGLLSLSSAREIEKRILFQSLIGSDEKSQSLSLREAHSGPIEQALGKISARQAVAADSLLWAELVWALKTKNLFAADRGPDRDSDAKARERLFDRELEKIFDGESQIDARGQRRWHDLNASLRVILKIFRNGQDVQQQISGDRSHALATLGHLDAHLRALDIFMNQWLVRRSLNPSGENAATAGHAAAWLRNILGEWLAIAIDVSASNRGIEFDFDARDIDVRLKKLKVVIEISNQRGSPREVEPTRNCQALFKAAP